MHIRDDPGSEGFGSCLQRNYYVTGYMRKNSNKQKVHKSSVDHVIPTKAKGTELIEFHSGNILYRR